jgi:polyisoprenoid-binding protein YceI
MKKIIVIIASVVFALTAKAQDVVSTAAGTISFFSATSMENIDATSNQAIAAMNIKTKKIFFKVKNTSFTFKSSLMQEHFNENYIESEKFPYSQFSGEIVDGADKDFSKDGVYEVTVKGKMNIHGVEKEYTTKGTITVKDGKVRAQAKFKIKIADHQIKVPSLVGANIAEDVEVTIDATMEPAKKK